MTFESSLLESISLSLASTYRQTGPKLVSNTISTPIGGSPTPTSDLGTNIIKIHHNLSSASYYKHALSGDNTFMSDTGALVTYSGVKTGRSPKDKRVVYDESSEHHKYVWWHQKNSKSPNYKMDPQSFLINRETAINYLTFQKELFVVDAFAGWDTKHRIKVRLISVLPYHAFFISNMLIKPTQEELKNFGEPEFVIYNAGQFPSNRYSTYMTSSTTIDFSLERQEIIILGTQYAGEMKKGIFSIMYYLMARKNILTLHSSTNTDMNNQNVCIFFGLSGTGKTTLSADPTRKLIGDDEHCWSNDGVFNIEGGCYAKCIGLTLEKEPDIYQAIKFGTILENVVINANGTPDYLDYTITKNTRASYPLEFIDNVTIPATSQHPDNIIFLTCDAFGVLPLVSKLSLEQAMYHFISGYTSKIAGTEEGVTEPQATFSACFGEPFLMCHPFIYAKMLYQKIKQHNTNVWLINTGWTKGKYGVGRRCPLKLTRQIVSDIHSGKLNELYKNNKNIWKQLAYFNLEYLANYYDSESYLDPMLGWQDTTKYLTELKSIADMFVANFETYSDNKTFSQEDINTIKKGGVVQNQEICRKLN